MMRIFYCSLIASWALGAVSAHAQVALPLTLAPSGTLRIDGSLREWRDLHFARVGSEDDGSMRIAFGYDEEALYVAAEVSDDRLERLGDAGPDDDAVVMTFAMPGRRGMVGTEIWLWPGQPGRSSAQAGMGPVGARPALSSSIDVIEAPSRRGYTLEARIPWRTIRGGRRWEEGRATVRLHDADGRSVNEIELSPVDRAHLERMPALRPSNGSAATLSAFLATQSLRGARPSADLRGDVGEDARPERVVVVDRFVVVFGPGWQNGQSYSFVQLPVVSSADLRDAALVDLTGDGKLELTLRMTQRGDAIAREVWTVVRFEEGVRPVFMIETKRETGNGRVRSRVDVRRGRRGAPATIRVRVGESRGFDASNFPAIGVSDAEAVLVPWGPVIERSYRWDGQRFAAAGERANPDYSPSANSGDAAARPGQAETSGGPSLDQLLAAFRERAGIRATRPRFHASVNLAAGPEPERLEVYGRELVVVGERFRGGNQWFHFRIPVDAASDVVDVRTAELTGDGRHEILIRARFASGDVRRTLLSVHQFTPSGFQLLFQREVGRAQGDASIDNEVVAHNRRLEIRPGRARGWSEESYPFRDPPNPNDGPAPPLLPWRDSVVRCTYVRGGFSCQ